MTRAKVALKITLLCFAFNVVCSHGHAAPYKSSIGGGAYTDSRQATHLAANILLAGVLLGGIIALVAKTAQQHSHTHD